MSGIAGVFRFDGRPVQNSELERAASTIAPYGRDRLGCVALKHVGLVHALGRMCPEDDFDQQPWTGGSGAVIVADLRLDNRDEILESLGIRISACERWSDSRILLEAWEKFKDEVWASLRGPFAAAIWDPRNQTLTLVRDHLGLNVVCWWRNSDLFAFGTMPKAIFALVKAPILLNEERFADLMVQNYSDQSSTIYKDVYRVPAAHWLSVRLDGSITKHRYWSHADIRPIELPTDQAYAETLRDHLDKAVRRQLRSSHRVGCYLSGGLDSSSVAVLLARTMAERNQRLTAFTHVPRIGFSGAVLPGFFGDDRPYVEEIARHSNNIDVTYVPNDLCDGFSELDKVFDAMEGPIRNPSNLGWMLTIARLAHAQGFGVLFGGLFGNFAASWDGWSQTAEHVMAGRFLTAFRQWRLHYFNTSSSVLGSWWRLIAQPLLYERVGWRDHLLGVEHRLWRNYSAIKPEFAKEMRVGSRARRAGHDFSYRLHSWDRFKWMETDECAGDWFAAQLALTGVEVRSPEADIDVVSYCLGIPAEQFLAEGIDRSLIRRAMWELLPRPIVTNRKRGFQSSDWHEALQRRREIFKMELEEFSLSPLVSRMIDLKRLKHATETWPLDGWSTKRAVSEYRYAYARAFAAGRFLRWWECNRRHE